MSDPRNRLKKVGVLMGGVSNERDISIISGQNVLSALQRLGYQAVGIDVKGNLPAKIAEQGIDSAFIALHGPGGEDGTIQGFLEYLRIPYTGSGVVASAIGIDKMAAKRILIAEGIPTPRFMNIDPHESLVRECDKIRDSFGLPAVVKPNNDGSSLGVRIVNDSDFLLRAVQELKNQYDSFFAEEYIKGKELTVGVLGTGPKAYSLPVLELETKLRFYDYEAKYTKGMTEFIIPAEISAELEKRVQNISVKIHRLFGCRDFSRVDFMIDEDGNPYVIEINTIPGFTNLSDLPAEARAAGMTFDQLIQTIMESAFGNR